VIPREGGGDRGGEVGRRLRGEEERKGEEGAAVWARFARERGAAGALGERGRARLAGPASCAALGQAGPRWLAGPRRRSGPNQGRRGWAASGKKKQAGLGCFWDWVGLPFGFLGWLGFGFFSNPFLFLTKQT